MRRDEVASNVKLCGANYTSGSDPARLFDEIADLCEQNRLAAILMALHLLADQLREQQDQLR